MERLRDVGAAPECEPRERDEQVAQVARTRARRQGADDPIVERRQADAVALAVHQVAERRGQTRGVLELARRRAIGTPSTR